MKTKQTIGLKLGGMAGLLALLLAAGCETSPRAVNAEAGPDGTVAFYIQVETSEPGAKIEVNGDYVGESPVKVKVFGHKDGTFHNFGKPEYVIRAFPVRNGQYEQIKSFRTGYWVTSRDPIPSRVYFDMNLKPGEAPGAVTGAESGPQGTIAYYVQVETNEKNVKIEANGEYAGTAPVKLKIYGDKDGTFHNFGSYQYVIKALPDKSGQYVQTKIFRTGGWFTPEDMIPGRVYFDMHVDGGGSEKK